MADLAPTVLVCLAAPEASVAVAEAAAGGEALERWVEVPSLPPEIMGQAIGSWHPTTSGAPKRRLVGGGEHALRRLPIRYPKGPAPTVAAARAALAPAAAEVYSS